MDYVDQLLEAGRWNRNIDELSKWSRVSISMAFPAKTWTLNLTLSDPNTISLYRHHVESLAIFILPPEVRRSWNTHNSHLSCCSVDTTSMFPCRGAFNRRWRWCSLLSAATDACRALHHRRSATLPLRSAASQLVIRLTLWVVTCPKGSESDQWRVRKARHPSAEAVAAAVFL